jgi:methyl-accepting chemotaxis protein
MSHTLTIARRVSLGFALLLLITLILGASSAWWMRSAAQSAQYLSAAVAPEADVTSRLAQASARTQLATRTYGLTGDPAQLELAQTNLAELEKALEACRELARREPSLEALVRGVTQADAALAAYRNGFEATRVNLTELAQIRAELDALAERFTTHIESYIATQEKSLAEEIAASAPPAKLEERRQKVTAASNALRLGNLVRIANFKTQALRDAQWVEKVGPHFDEIDRIIDALIPVTRQERNLQELRASKSAAQDYRTGIARVVNNAATAKALAGQRLKAATDLDTVVAAVLNGAIDHTSTRTSDTSHASRSAG